MKNNKGFTLIELLAVITIMGILMMVAIPTVSRTIENSRKDTFLDTVKQYVAGAKNMWAADNLKCGDYVSSAVQNGWYYVEINTASNNVPVLLEQGGKSPWGQRDIVGFILVHVYEKNGSRVVDYYPAVTDGIHGNVECVGPSWNISNRIRYGTIKKDTALVRGDIVMSGARYDLVGTYNDSSKTLANFTIYQPCYDVNNNNGCNTANRAIKCVEV